MPSATASSFLITEPLLLNMVGITNNTASSKKKNLSSLIAAIIILLTITAASV